VSVPIAPSVHGPPPFEVEIDRSGPDVVIVLHGELDMAGLLSLALVIDEATDHSSERLILDLADLSFIDASGIRAVRSARRRLGADGTEVVVRAVQPFVRRVFRLCGLGHWGASA
jgi:anti-anti-sigma factor